MAMPANQALEVCCSSRDLQTETGAKFIAEGLNPTPMLAKIHDMCSEIIKGLYLKSHCPGVADHIPAASLRCRRTCHMKQKISI